MIFSFTSESISDKRYFVCLKKTISESTLLKRGKATAGTYAGNLLARLYDALFRRSLELKSDYTRYYSVEYSTFADYLHKRFLVNRKLAEQVSAQFSRSKQIVYFQPIFSFFYDEYGDEFLRKLLEPGKKK